MQPKPPEVLYAEQQGVLVVRVDGDLDAAASAPLIDGFDRASARSSASEVLLDLAKCAYINSTGIALIVTLLARCQSRGLTVSARGLTDHHRHVFKITRISDHLRVLPAEPTATGTS